jgi:hypothetical protein
MVGMQANFRYNFYHFMWSPKGNGEGDQVQRFTVVTGIRDLSTFKGSGNYPNLAFSYFSLGSNGI